jgi:photosystem II stability/assembly factor-like uncharacterized protein
MKTTKKYFLIILNLMISVQLFAQWNSIKAPNYGDIYDLAIVNQNLFAATNYGGIFKSTNNGQTWSESNNGLPTNFRARTIINVNGVLFTGGIDTRPYKSLDLGNTWVPSFSGIAYNNFGTFINDLHQHQNNLYCATNNGIYKSINNGNTWQLLQTGLPINFNSKKIQSDGNNLYVSTQNSLFESQDSGNTWVNISYDVPNFESFDVKNGLFIAVGSTGIYKRTSNDTTWVYVPDNILGYSNYTSVQINNAFILYGSLKRGAFRSDINTSAIVEINNNNPFYGNEYDRIYFLEQRGNLTYMGSQGGLHVSSDVLNSPWSNITNDMSNSFVGAIALEGNTFLIGTRNHDWDEDDPLVLLYTGARGIYVSQNSGQDFTMHQLQPLFHMDNYSIISACILNDSTFIAGTKAFGLFKTTNYGQSWYRVNTPPPNVPELLGKVNTIVNVNGVIYAGGEGVKDLYKSTDMGETWTEVSSYTGSIVYTIYHEDTTIYLGTSNKVFKSSDNGQSWSIIGNSMPSALRSVLRYNGKLIAAGGNDVFYYDTNTSTWNEMNGGLSYYDDVNTAAVYDNKLCIGTNTGVYYFDNSTNVWISSNLGMNNRLVKTLYSKDNRLFAGTIGNGVYEFSGSMSAAKEINGASFKIWPNPANTFLKIYLNSLEHKYASYIITDTRGSKIIQGKISNQIDVSSLPQGMFLIELIGEDGNSLHSKFFKLN